MRLLPHVKLYPSRIVLLVEFESDFVLVEDVENAAFVATGCGDFVHQVDALDYALGVGLGQLEPLWEVFGLFYAVLYHGLREFVA
jgi:hypothetical protein